MAYEMLEPFGAEHERNLANWQCMTTANFSQMMVKDENGNRKLWEPSDFIPNPIEEPKKVEIKKKQSTEELKTALLGLASNSKRIEDKKAKIAARAAKKAMNRKLRGERK